MKTLILTFSLLAFVPAFAQYDDVTTQGIKKGPVRAYDDLMTPDINEGAIGSYDDLMTPDVNEGAIDWD